MTTPALIADIGDQSGRRHASIPLCLHKRYITTHLMSGKPLATLRRNAVISMAVAAAGK